MTALLPRSPPPFRLPFAPRPANPPKPAPKPAPAPLAPPSPAANPPAAASPAAAHPAPVPARSGGLRRPRWLRPVAPEALHWWAVWLLFGLAIWHFALAQPRPASVAPFFLTIGAVASWRYGWWGLHQIRAAIYLRRRFPRLRAAVEAQPGPGLCPVPHIYVVVLSYDIEAALLMRCYRALLAAAQASGRPTTIIASITSDRDVRLLNRVFAEAGAPPGLRLCAQFQNGAGKRLAIGEALRAIARDLPAAGTLTVLMDGDIVLGPDALARSVPFFTADQGLAAATTNNAAEVSGGSLARNWFVLRMAQRHALMASMALSQRLMVLTGRFSLFRTEIAISEAFVHRVEHDSIGHWRLGPIRFLTGDDKSTWFQVLSEGRRMLYIPDVLATGIEELPAPGRFLPATTRLMSRWFGNMLRANGRAIALGPRVTGPFLWWALIDQRVSIWTALTGPIATALLAAFYSPVFVLYYLALALATRSLMALAAGLHYGAFSPSWPFLMYYNQLWGAVLKSSLTFHLDRQSWTRQAIAAQAQGRLETRTGHALHLAVIGLFTLGVGMLTGVLDPLGAGTLADLAGLLRP